MQTADYTSLTGKIHLIDRKRDLISPEKEWF